MIDPRQTSSAAALDPALARLVDELTAKIQRGETVDLSAVLREHSEHADELRALLPALAALGDLSGSAGAGGMVFPITADGSASGTLGDFRLVREIGRGGMGIVYEAEQISLNRKVALKVLPFAATLDPRQLQRFRHEAQAAAMLHHPHIVPVHGVGCERGVHYFAMHLVEGHSLAMAIDGLRETAIEARPSVSPAPENASTPPVRRPQHETEQTGQGPVPPRGGADRPGGRRPRVRALDGRDPSRHQAG